MGKVDSFFKANEQQWFWALAEMLQLGLAERHPDRPEPVPIRACSTIDSHFERYERRLYEAEEGESRRRS